MRISNKILSPVLLLAEELVVTTVALFQRPGAFAVTFPRSPRSNSRPAA